MPPSAFLPDLPDYDPEPANGVRVNNSPVSGLTLRRVLRGHTEWIGRIAWSPDGLLLASPSKDQTISIWDVASGKVVCKLTWPSTISSVAWSPNSQHLACASWDNTVCLWEVASGNLVQTLQGHTNSVYSISWSPDGQCLASASSDQTIRLWEVASGKPLQTLQGHTNRVNSVVWSPDGQCLASASSDQTIRLWEVASGKPLQTLQGHTNRVNSVVWSPDGQCLASASLDQTIRLWEVASGKLLQVLEGHANDVNCATFSTDGRWLASKDSGRDGTVRLWRCDTWACVAQLEERAPEYWVPSVAFHPHQPLLLATLGENDRTIRIWELDESLLCSQVQKSVHYTTAKIVLVGDSGVGKTGLGYRLAHNEFKEHVSTHGQQFWVINELGKTRDDGTQCEAVLWDLAGQHVYRSIHSIFLDYVNASLVLFDPSNRQDPLKGAEFWLEQLKGKGQLPPSVLIGARVDRGAPTLSQQDLEQFCQRYGISGGYISTSAMTGDGLPDLLERLKAQIPWDEMTTTVTTVTFKRIKDYLLALKEQPDRKNVLVSPVELRVLLETSEVWEGWTFTDAEMMTAVGHLENHGYVYILRSSAVEQSILLKPELLVGLAASIVLQADKHPRELGAINEAELLKGNYAFDELKGLEPAEQQLLLDAAVLRFLDHSICFRETLDNDTLLIFPALIKQKRPLQDDTPFSDDISYIVRGRVENIYATLVVLLGYTPSFLRINHWQNQAQYEMDAGQICGFRMLADREGEIELVLYYGDQMPTSGRTAFQTLFEQFLYQREVEVTRFPPVLCENHHRLERATVTKRSREGKTFAFCEECGSKVDLPALQPSSIGTSASPWLQREEAIARLRNNYETHLSNVKSFRRQWAAPRCYPTVYTQMTESN